MSVDPETVKRIARLARIRVDQDELAGFAAELNGILGFIEQLASVPVDQVPAMTSGVDLALPWRADQVTDGGNPEIVLANAPGRMEGFYTVPKVVE